MKFELDVVRFNTLDVITASACDDPSKPVQVGGDMVLNTCPSKI